MTLINHANASQARPLNNVLQIHDSFVRFRDWRTLLTRCSSKKLARKGGAARPRPPRRSLRMPFRRADCIPQNGFDLVVGSIRICGSSAGLDQGIRGRFLPLAVSQRCPANCDAKRQAVRSALVTACPESLRREEFAKSKGIATSQIAGITAILKTMESVQPTDLANYAHDLHAGGSPNHGGGGRGHLAGRCRVSRSAVCSWAGGFPSISVAAVCSSTEDSSTPGVLFQRPWAVPWRQRALSRAWGFYASIIGLDKSCLLRRASVCCSDWPESISTS